MADEANPRCNAAFSSGRFGFEEAVADAEVAVALRPDWPRGYSLLGAARLALGDDAGAVEACEKGLAIDPSNEALRFGLTLSRAALAQWRKLQSVGSSGCADETEDSNDTEYLAEQEKLQRLMLMDAENMPADSDEGEAVPLIFVPVIEFNVREDVERLLRVKMISMPGLTRLQMDYITNLKACIHWLMERDNRYLAGQENLRGSVDADNAQASSDNGGGEATPVAPVVKVSSRENVEQLLAVDAANRTNKWRRKYIKKMRACIRNYIQHEELRGTMGAYLAPQPCPRPRWPPTSHRYPLRSQKTDKLDALIYGDMNADKQH